MLAGVVAERIQRAELLAQAFGLGSLALPWLLSREGVIAAPTKPFTDGEKFDLTTKPPPRYGQAKAMISLFMIGGPSQMDLFDPKPILTRKHGQTIDALQYLANAAVFRRGHGTPVTIDAAGYRERRRTTLEGIALRAAERAAEGERVLLEPMTSVERKVVHERLKDVEGVSTTSEGTEPNRYVVVLPA